MEGKHKHLEFIQTTISRMAGNSFLLRGWSITLVVAILTIASQFYKPLYLWIALFVTIVFWLLDSYYLSQERRFRCLYDEVRVKTGEADFSMKLTENHCKKCTWLSAARAPIFLIFYGVAALILVGMIFTIYLNVSIAIK